MSGITAPSAVHMWKQTSEAAEQMNIINAQLWALATFDTALQHFVELRQRLETLPQRLDSVPRDYAAGVSLDRALGQYIQHQCVELTDAAGVAVLAINDRINQIIGRETFTHAIYHVVGVTDDPLAVEILTYAAYLSCFTAHDLAPWSRAHAAVEACFYTKHPLAKKVQA